MKRASIFVPTSSQRLTVLYRMRRAFSLATAVQGGFQYGFRDVHVIPLDCLLPVASSDGWLSAPYVKSPG